MEYKYKQLGEVCSLVRGSSPRPKGDPRFYGGKVPRLMISDITRDGKYTTPKTDFLTEEGTKLSRSMKKGEVIMAVSGNPGLATILEVDACIHDGFVGFRELKSEIKAEFLYYYLNFYKDLHGSQSVGAVFKNLNTMQIKKFKVPIPPLPIQHKIVSILKRAEKLKNLRQEANDETNSIIQALFYEMFGDPIKNEKGYNIKPLVEMCHRITDGTHVTPKYTEKGTPFLRVTDLTNSNQSKKFISEDEHKELIKRCKPEKGDILYSKNGTIGIAKLIDWDYEFSIFVSLCLIKPKIDVILPKYLEIFLNTPFALRQALLHSKKGTITNLHLIEIKKILVPMPSLKEQEAFLKRIEQINNIQNKQEQSTEEISTLFDALMQKAFNGELVA